MHASLDISDDVPKQQKHLGELDSLRGIAAVAVMFFHFHFLWEESPHPRWEETLFMIPPLKFLIAGHAAVILFFLLSGFVLALPQIRGKKQSYAGYISKRICRIYLPYLVALSLAVAGCWRFHGLHAFGYWFHLTWYAAPSRSLVLQHLLFVGDYDSSAYNTAFWSVVQEMRISIAFPFVCGFILRRSNTVGVIIGVLLFVIAFVVERFALAPATVSAGVSYLGIFIFGILAARARKEMSEWLRQMSRMKLQVFLWSSVFLFFYAHHLAVVLRAGVKGTDLLTAIAGVGIILYSLADRRASAALTSRVPRFLGRISYSLYLLHGTVLFALVYMTYGKLPLLSILVPFFVITIGLATAMYEVVEVPSINLGHAIADRLERKRPAVPESV
jgi:peptidoglycan/LPS O-acetylase OafA/YrhL